MKTTKLSAILLFAILSSCTKKETVKSILIENTLDFKRTSETIELSASFLNETDVNTVGIRDAETGEFQITQTVHGSTGFWSLYWHTE